VTVSLRGTLGTAIGFLREQFFSWRREGLVASDRIDRQHLWPSDITSIYVNGPDGGVGQAHSLTFTFMKRRLSPCGPAVNLVSGSPANK